MGELMVNPLDRTVQIRGISFPVDGIHAAMLETGGQVVADRNLNVRLDRAMHEHIMVKGSTPDYLVVESEPGIVFIPKKVKLHARMKDMETDTGIYLYFAARKQFHA